uniref:Uncharacterized protein n=1 Tax=Oscillatoriales cyanobacterium SpSt-418 TaxID=2282169 RepID=A0A7C3KCZ8_9CYAN
MFVPKPNSRAEADGWVLDLVYDTAHNQTDVVILNGVDFDRGAIARLYLKHHVPYGLHSCFSSLV